MRKIAILLMLFVFASWQMLSAQTKVVTGTVTSADDGATLPGVSVMVKGTTIGMSTDIDGKYEIKVPENAILIFASLGYQDQEVKVGNQTVINVILQSANVQMDEVVVTALGITRKTKALGYSVTEVGGEDVASSPTTNISENLSGKIAGVQVTTASGNMGGSSRVLLRGASSLQSNNQPLYVVDGVPIDNGNYADYETQRGGGGVDYGNMSQDINPDDIATVSILKGPSASALYGSRAANGAIVITTKSGKKSQDLGVNVSFTGTWENVSRLPKYQNLYGAGYGDSFETRVINGTTYNIPNYGMDESWGPKLDGTQVIPFWAMYEWEQGGKVGAPQTAAWSPQPDNIRDFFETGFMAKTNVSAQGGTEKSTFRLSYSNIEQKGVFPNSKLARNSVGFNGTHDLSDKVYVGTSATYVKNTTRALPMTGYDGIMSKFSQWGQRQWDMSKMKTYKNADGTQRTWNRNGTFDPSPAYSDNAYWTQYENYGESSRDRLTGNFFGGYKFTDYLKVQGKVMMDSYTDRRETRTAVGSQSSSEYSEYVRQFSEVNYELMASFNKNLNDDFTLSAMVGTNRMERVYHINGGITDGGLSVPGVYNLTNSKSSAVTTDDYNKKRINSVFGNATLDWRSLVYVDLTARNDWSSTLPLDNNSYFYWSSNLSILLTELDAFKNLNWLSFAKLRGGYAEVGNDTDPYQLATTYASYQGVGSLPRYSNPTSLSNANLLPEKTKSWEVGLDLRFLDNRINLDATVYGSKTYNQIMPISVSAASGFTSKWINAGTMSNKGVEISLNLVPIRTKDFNWDISLNFAKNNNKVDELAPGLKNINLGVLFGVYVTAHEGEAYGMLRGANFVFDDNGNKIVGSDGLYKKSAELESLGSVLPDYNAGMVNTVSYKGISFSFTIDHQQGGHFFSLSNMWGHYSGLLEATAVNGVRENGLVVDGVKEDGTPNDVVVSATDYYESYYGSARGGLNVFEATYYKLREVSLGYTLPKSITSKLGPIKGATINLVGKNLAMWGTDNPHLDPEQITNGGNVQGIEGGGNPPTRTVGFNVSFKF